MTKEPVNGARSGRRAPKPSSVPVNDRWYDLAEQRYDAEQDPKSYWLAPMHYFWPERI